jgi:hypothetical protein
MSYMAVSAFSLGVEPLQQPAALAPAASSSDGFFSSIASGIGKTLTAVGKGAVVAVSPAVTQIKPSASLFTDPISGKRFAAQAERDAYTREQASGASTKKMMIIGGVAVGALALVLLLKK